MKSWLDVYDLFEQIIDDVENSGKYVIGGSEFAEEVNRRVELLVSAFPENEHVKIAYERWNEDADEF